MLASVISSFTREPSRIADEHSYQSLVIKSLMIIKDTKIIPLGTESSHYLTLDHTNSNALRVINNRIQKQINASDILYVAIDRGLTESMIARVIEATKHNPNIIIKFYTLFSMKNIVGQLIHAVNNEEFDDNIKRVIAMGERLQGFYLRNKLMFNTQGDLTDYKSKYFKFLREINSEQEVYINSLNNEYQS